MRLTVSITLLLFGLLFQPISAMACSARMGWRAPTPENAFKAAEVVVHVRVVAVEAGKDRESFNATVQTVRALKGTFSGHTINTGSESRCGVGELKVDQEYVFFFTRSGQWLVQAQQQPQGATTEQMVAAILALKKQ